jgi:hypothetical protein
MMGKIAQTRLDAPGAVLVAGAACLIGSIAFAGHLPKVHKRAT